MCELLYSTAAVAASPKDKLLVAMPSKSVMTARGTRILQQRFSIREAMKMDNEERSMLVSMTRTLYPGVIRKEVNFDGLVLGTRRGRRGADGVRCHLAGLFLSTFCFCCSSCRLSMNHKQFIYIVFGIRRFTGCRHACFVSVYTRLQSSQLDQITIIHDFSCISL